MHDRLASRAYRKASRFDDSGMHRSNDEVHEARTLRDHGIGHRPVARSTERPCIGESFKAHVALVGHLALVPGEDGAGHGDGRQRTGVIIACPRQRVRARVGAEEQVVHGPAISIRAERHAAFRLRRHASGKRLRIKHHVTFDICHRTPPIVEAIACKAAPSLVQGTTTRANAPASAHAAAPEISHERSGPTGGAALDARRASACAPRPDSISIAVRESAANASAMPSRPNPSGSHRWAATPATTSNDSLTNNPNGGIPDSAVNAPSTKRPACPTLQRPWRSTIIVVRRSCCTMPAAKNAADLAKACETTWKSAANQPNGPPNPSASATMPACSTVEYASSRFRSRWVSINVPATSAESAPNHVRRSCRNGATPNAAEVPTVRMIA